MYCTRCRKKFDIWESEFGYKIKDFCKECHDRRWKTNINFVGKDTYCIKCGAVHKKIKSKTKYGKVFFTSAIKRVCEKCKAVPKKIKKCIVCDTVIEGRAYKYCKNCKPYKKQKNNPLTNRKSSIRWQKKNPEKVKVSQLSRYHYHKVNILYECVCENENKVNHHFDYDRPFEVIRLCPTCHSAEHVRLRSLKTKMTATA